MKYQHHYFLLYSNTTYTLAIAQGLKCNHRKTVDSLVPVIWFVKLVSNLWHLRSSLRLNTQFIHAAVLQPRLKGICIVTAYEETSTMVVQVCDSEDLNPDPTLF